MMTEPKFKIDIFRKKTVEEFSALLADPGSRMGSGSAAAASGAIAASLLARTANLCSSEQGTEEQLEWFVRNSEILRSYMLNLIDEDVKCHGPLLRAEKEGDPRKIEASRQAAVCICLEIVNMMGKCLEMVEGIIPFTNSESMLFAVQSAELAYSASLAAGNYILKMSSLSTDETYRYIMKRENELTMQAQQENLNRILAASV